MKSFTKPQLFIITGSNGAGKSTYKQSLLPSASRTLEIFDGDIFYAQKSIEFYKIYKSSKEARKLAEEALEKEFLRLVDSSISQMRDFAYEGHFTGKGAWEVPARLKKEGFDIHLIFCGLNTLVRSIQRVDLRVKSGGFHVTALAIENNYFGNMEMLNKNFRMFNSVKLIDTSGKIIQIATLENGVVTESIDANKVPDWLKRGMPEVFQTIKKFNFDNP